MNFPGNLLAISWGPVGRGQLAVLSTSNAVLESRWQRRRFAVGSGHRRPTCPHSGRRQGCGGGLGRAAWQCPPRAKLAET